MNVAGLALTDAVHLCATRWAGSFGGRLAVLHRYLLRVLHLPLGPALQTIRFHTEFLPFLLCGRRLAAGPGYWSTSMSRRPRRLDATHICRVRLAVDSLGRIIALFQPMSRVSKANLIRELLQRREYFLWMPAVCAAISEDREELSVLRIGAARRIEIDAFRTYRRQHEKLAVLHVPAMRLA